jgi:hypothetical protein
MAELDPVRELLADLGRRIHQEQMRAMEQIDRIKAIYADPDRREELEREQWRRCALAVEPLVEQRMAIIKQIVELEAMKPPNPAIIGPGDKLLS